MATTNKDKTVDETETVEITEKEKELNKTMEQITAKELKLNDKQCDTESICTADELKKDMVEITIPIDQLNKNDKTVDVFINGYRWTIQRNVEVSVPREVKRILKEAKYI